MGTDIHSNIEIRYRGEWIFFAPLIPNKYYDPERPLSEWNQPKTRDKGFSDRNYNLFAILANVRNRYKMKPISEPRGLPKDIDLATLEKDDLGDHSFSWLTLKEIVDYDWDQVVQESGYITEVQFLAWDGKSQPSSWSGGVGGGKIIPLTAQEYRELKDKDLRKEYYIFIDWVLTYKDAVGASVWKNIERLKSYVSDPSDLRLVFGFDS